MFQANRIAGLCFVLIVLAPASARADIKVAQFSFSGSVTDPTDFPFAVGVVPRGAPCDTFIFVGFTGPLVPGTPAVQLRNEALADLMANAPAGYAVASIAPGGIPGIQITANADFDVCAHLAPVSPLATIVSAAGMGSVTIHGITVAGVSKSKTVTGACCRNGTNCDDNVAEANCQDHFYAGRMCADLTPGECPALLPWGLVVFGALVAVVGARVLRKSECPDPGLSSPIAYN